MKTSHRLVVALLFACLPSLYAAPPADSLQHLTSSDQVPEGLAKSDWSSIRAAYEAGRHAAHREKDGTLTARNPGQQWRTEFDGKGFTITPDAGGWTWGLELTGYGERTLLSASSPTYEGGKITCQRDAYLTEWFINDSSGLEQGWTFRNRAEGTVVGGALLLDLSVRGGLIPQVSKNGGTVSFQNQAGTCTLTYGGLIAWDADGRKLDSHFEAAGEKEIRVTVNMSDARYPITIDPIAQQAYLKASNTNAGDEFGFCVASSGDTVVVGAPKEDSNARGTNGNQSSNASIDSGAVYVFVRNGSTWSQQAYLKASNADPADQFGSSVSISGDTLVVGAGWEGSTATGVGGDQANNEQQGAGAAYVFVRSSGGWSQQAYLKASDTVVPEFPWSPMDPTPALFGSAVAVSGDMIAVYAPFPLEGGFGDQPAAIYLFVRNGTSWTPQIRLTGSTVFGMPSFLEFQFGEAIDLDGDTLVFSGSGVRNGSQVATAEVHVRDGAAWPLQAVLTATGPGNLAAITPVAISGNTVVLGAPLEGTATNEFLWAGAAYVFNRSGTSWNPPVRLPSSNAVENGEFGIAVAVSGSTIVVGELGESGEFGRLTGAAHVYSFAGSSWIQDAYLLPQQDSSEVLFGSAVAVSGNTIAVGSRMEDSDSSGINGDPLNHTAWEAGAVYLFRSTTPEIAIEQPLTSNVPDDGSRNFGNVALGSHLSLTFTIKNTGDADLTGLLITQDGTDSADFTLTSSPTAPVAGPNGSTTFTIQFTPTTPGAKTAAIHIANNDADETPFDINLTGTAATTLNVFNNAIASSTALAGPDAAPMAIPFHDGLVNLLKYAFNMNLAGPDSSSLTAGTGNAGLPAFALVGTGPATMIQMEFVRRKGSGLVYTAKHATDLTTFAPMTGTTTVTPIDDQWERVLVQEPCNPSTTPRCFGIVEVRIP